MNTVPFLLAGGCPTWTPRTPTPIAPRSVDRRPGIPGTCQHCGKAYEGRPGSKFCSQPCGVAGRIEPVRARASKPDLTREAVCAVCARSFVASSPRVTCSERCGRAALVGGKRPKR